jgi:hypothetical protein
MAVQSIAAAASNNLQNPQAPKGIGDANNEHRILINRENRGARVGWKIMMLQKQLSIEAHSKRPHEISHKMTRLPARKAKPGNSHK